MNPESTPDLHDEPPFDHELTTRRVTPGRFSQPPLEVVANLAIPPDPMQQPVPPASAQSGEILEELSLLRQRIGLLEQALADARRVAHYDHVTGIPNRGLLEDRFEHAKGRSDRQGTSLAVLFVDIDGFKKVNDVYGHAVGDDLLRRIAARLARCIRSADTVCRYGGDEFVVLLPESDGRNGAITATRKIRRQLASPYSAGTGSIALPASIGMALYPADGMELAGLIQQADAAMYREKATKGSVAYDLRKRRAHLPTNCTAIKSAHLEDTGARNEPEWAFAPEDGAFTGEAVTSRVAGTPFHDSTTRKSE